MKLFNSLGLIEIVFVLIIGIIVLGPEETVKLGGKLGKLMRNVVTSKWWRSLQDSLNELKHLPYKLMREAQLEELGEELKELEQMTREKTNLNREKIDHLQKDLQDKVGQLQDELGPSAWRGDFNPQPPSSPAKDETSKNA